MKEVRKDIKGYEGLYKVSNIGRVKSLDNVHTRTTKSGVIVKRLKKGKIKKIRVRNPTKRTDVLYLTVGLCKHHKGKDKYIHRLVAGAFIGNIGKGLEVAHIDGNPQNNIVSNLKICTHKENEKDKIAHGTTTIGEKNGMSKLSDNDIKKILKTGLLYGYYIPNKKRHWYSKIINKINIDFKNVGRTAVYSILTGRSWKHIYNNFLPKITLQKNGNLQTQRNTE